VAGALASCDDFELSSLGASADCVLGPGALPLIDGSPATTNHRRRLRTPSQRILRFQRCPSYLDGRIRLTPLNRNLNSGRCPKALVCSWNYPTQSTLRPQT